MRVEVRERLNGIAEVTANNLLAALNQKQVARIDIVMIKTKLREHSKYPKDFQEREYLIDRAVRRVVELTDKPVNKVHY